MVKVSTAMLASWILSSSWILRTSLIPEVITSMILVVGRGAWASTSALLFVWETLAADKDRLIKTILGQWFL